MAELCYDLGQAFAGGFIVDEVAMWAENSKYLPDKLFSTREMQTNCTFMPLNQSFYDLISTLNDQLQTFFNLTAFLSSIDLNKMREMSDKLQIYIDKNQKCLSEYPNMLKKLADTRHRIDDGEFGYMMTGTQPGRLYRQPRDSAPHIFADL